MSKRWKAITATGVAAAAGLGAVAMSNLPAANAGVGLAPSVHMIKVTEVKKADPKTDWHQQIDRGRLPGVYCGVWSTEGKNVAQRFGRGYTDDLATFGRQHLTRYQTKAAAAAAYKSVVKTVLSCPAGKPAPTHARKITENRVVRGAGDATRVVRWYDYPKPNDPGSEDGTFLYSVSLKGTVVSVLYFQSYGHGMKPVNFDKLARLAPAKLPG